MGALGGRAWVRCGFPSFVATSAGLRNPLASTLLLVGDDLPVAGQVNRLRLLAERQVVDMHGDLLLAEDLLRLEVKEQHEAVVGAAGAEQPVAAGVEGQSLDEPLEPAAGQLVGALALLPVEHLDADGAVQVVDVADPADAAGR